MLPKVDYLRTKEVLLQQREAILNKIREKSRAHVIHEGIKDWPSAPLVPKVEDGEETSAMTLAKGALLDPQQIPGLKESGWTFETAAQQAVAPPPVNRTVEEQKMKRLLQLLMSHKMAWPFLQPVNPSEVIDYYTVIKHPMGTCPSIDPA
jgi:histone acetyltransferase